MKLSYSPTSPYARKVRAVAHFKGISGRVELVAIDTWNVPESLRAANPLGKVPCLTRDDGTSLYDFTRHLRIPRRLDPGASSLPG